MKILFISTIYMICFLLFTMNVNAIKADSKPIKVTLPDGSKLTICIHGDENFHYATTLGGSVIERGKDGYFYYAQITPDGNKIIGNIRVNSYNTGNTNMQTDFIPRNLMLFQQAKQVSASKRNSISLMNNKIDWKKNSSFPLTGRPKALILLMEYADVKFSIDNPQQAFDRMANQEGYSDYGATGSIRDYFRYNSSGAFDPEFVIIGPITLSHDRDYYEGDIMFKAIPEIFDKAVKTGLNLNEFDNNHDGILDNFFIYFAGHNWAESGVENTIWPHRSSVYGMNYVYNGIRLSDYACTSELKGSASSTQMCGIGTFCHEFCHVLGLSDLYDLDAGVDGATAGVFSFSLMSSGNYNNEGRTPPSLSAVERNILGWLEFEELDAKVKYYNLPPISANKAYAFYTKNQGEFFVLENRNTDNQWDKHLAFSDAGKGLLVYHVDCSENMVNGRTAKDRWQSSGINDVLAHPCLRLIPAAGPQNYEKGDYGSYMFFPGKENTTSLNFVPWSKEKIENRIERITLINDTIHFAYYETTTLAEQITITPNTVNLEVLHGIQLEASMLPEDVSNPTIIWSSSDNSIVRVDKNGFVVGVAEGSAKVIARSADGNAETHCNVKVAAGEMKEYKDLEIRQREIRISWTETDISKIWLIKWKKSKNTNFQTFETDTTFFIINHLEPNTEYDLEITAIVNDKETTPIIQKSFKTQDLTGKFPAIQGIRSDWQEGDKYWPVVTNIQKDVRKIIWKINGKIFPATHDLILHAGEHKLQAEITTGDGITETIIRKINVKSKKK